jgi:hypothetical protein
VGGGGGDEEIGCVRREIDKMHSSSTRQLATSSAETCELVWTTAAGVAAVGRGGALPSPVGGGALPSPVVGLSVCVFNIRVASSRYTLTLLW